MTGKLRIIVSGLAGLQPLGGMAWHYFQYVLGLARLGCDVYYHEDTWTWPYHPTERRNTDSGRYSADFIKNFFVRHAVDLSGNWHYLHLHNDSFGMTRKQFTDIARTADVFLNVSGANFIPEELNPNCLKVFIDTDPGYNQVLLSEKFGWSEFVDRWCQIISEHDHFLTFAENINSQDCLVPDLGWHWIPTRMPIVLEAWPMQDRSSFCEPKAWTSIMSWSVFKGPVKFQGIEYFDKGKEFDRIKSLPKKTGVPMTLAIGGHKAPLEELKAQNWNLIDAPDLTRTAEQYRSFIQDSRGEISIAKHIYVAMRTGWFSDRSACYLASGKPVILQDTGFSNHLPSGEGLHAFNSIEEAEEALNIVESDYGHHSKAAREIAYDYFDSDKVLTKLLTDIGC